MPVDWDALPLESLDEIVRWGRSCEELEHDGKPHEGGSHDVGKGKVVKILNNHQALILRDDGFEDVYNLIELIVVSAETHTEAAFKHIPEHHNDEESSIKKTSKRHKQNNGKVWEIDLHIEHLVDKHKSLSNYEIVQIQIRHCEFTIEKAIKKGVGELDNIIIEEVSYEGYGPFGIAILVEAITDNKNRTVADVRHALSKFGGSLGQTGSVSWNFERTGIILIDKNKIAENDIFEFSVENDCIEFFEDEDCFRLHFNSNDLYSKLDILEALNIPVDSSFLAHVPKDEIKLSKDEHDKVEKLLDFLEELEDIQNVFSNQTLGLN